MKQIFGAALCCLALVASAALAQPAKQETYQFVPSAEQVGKLKQDPSGFYSQMLLRGGDNNLVMITARDKSGEAESHAFWNDVIFVQAGEATMRLGGTMEDPRTVSSGEMRGSGISGAKTMVVHAGDYVYVPVNTAHRMILSPGKSVRYAVVKTRP
jgi:mannose-6-phosphate isomerase-like protein (cupin superfamily)